MTYYKYAEREANSQINWAEVSKGLADTITQVDKDRQAKKAAIDEETRKDMLTLADGPKGENTTASEWTIKYANDMMNYRLTIDRLLKQGKMSLRDYQVAAQNSKDATNLVFTISKEYQDQYKVIMDRAKTIGKNGMAQSSRLEPELAAMNESLANISSTVPYINSTNGMVYLATGVPGEDGVQKMGDNYVSLQALRNRVSAKIDSYSLSDGLSNAASKLGENTISELSKTDFRRTGVVTEISDPTLRKTFTDWENATVKEVMASEYRLASIMADNMNINPRTGNQYTATYNKKEFDADKSGDLILMENQNGSGVIMPQFKEEQRKDVEAFIKGQIRTYIDQKTEKRPFQEPGVDYAPQYVYEAGKAAKDQTAGAGAWNQLYTGRTAAEKKAAADILIGTPIAKKEELVDIDLESEPGKVILKYLNPAKNRTIDFFDASNNPISLRDFAGKGVELHGVVDRDEAVKAGGGGTTFGRITDYSGIRSSREGESVSTKVAVPLSAITEESGKASSTLQSSLPDGFVVNDMGGPFYNDIKVTAPNGKTYEYTSKKGATDAATIKRDLEVFIKTNNVKPKPDKNNTTPKEKGPIAAPGGTTFGSTTKPRG
jgi:hypothetical protein